MSTVNIVRFYFHKANVPKSRHRMAKLISLAYRTARDQKLYPKAVLIRSEIHSTTKINNTYQPDPSGAHLTLCFKDQDQLRRGVHTASHGYVADSSTALPLLKFTKATHTKEKPDSTVKNKKGLVVWPAKKKLWAAPEIGYAHVKS